jgi:hypothetical protein
MTGGIMDRSTYVITRNGAEALALGLDPMDLPVRYAASLSDGRGLVAMEYEPTMDEVWGEVWNQQEPNPDYPDTWPDWLRKGGRNAPKRARMTGREVFSMLDYHPAIEEVLHQTLAVTGICRVERDGVVRLLVESDGPVSVGWIWQGAAIEATDRRMVTA